MTALLLGIVVLMTTKPDLVSSIIVLRVARLLGVVSGVLVARTTRSGGQSVSGSRATCASQ